MLPTLVVSTQADWDETTMSKIKGLFQKAWAAVANPGQDERVAIIVAAIGKALNTQRMAFDLDKVIEPIDCTVTDVRAATKKYYEGLLQRYWADGVPDKSRQKTLAFVEERLQLDSRYVSKVREEVAVTYFGIKLGEYLADGTLTDLELASLNEISSFLNLTVPHFVQRHLSQEGLGLLRGIFAQAIRTGVLSNQSWSNLCTSASRLGIGEDTLKKSSSSLAKSFVEHVLADSKSDELLTQEEEKYLDWLISEFPFESAFVDYVRDEVALLREKTLLSKGRIQSIPIPHGVNLKAGELLYFFGESVLYERSNSHDGRLYLTDSRLLFESETKSIQITYPRIVSWHATSDGIWLAAANKPELIFDFPENPDQLLPNKLSTIIQLHSQQLTRKAEGVIDRHIPRDVRQRVWQTYGGMCVECSATDYLEFDHIVPVARGGSNAEQNIQLLCRKCNLTKSDKI
jgi:hypothetical protein